MFTNIIRKITVLRLILALVVLASWPAQTHAAFIDMNGISSWLKDNITSIAWAEKPETANADSLATVNGNALISSRQSLVSVLKVYDTFVTAYSSSIDETDDTPFITASGKTVRDGIVAANFLPLGTKIRIPEVFGNKIFIVEDRMNRRHTDKVDIWFATKELAKTFGRKKLEVQVIDDSI